MNLKRCAFAGITATFLLLFSLAGYAQTYNIVVQAFPAIGGTITVNGTVYSSFPATAQISSGAVADFIATANGGYQFSSWHVVFQTPMPNNTANPMNFTVQQNDTVYAFFSPLPPPDSSDVVLLVNPPGAGSIILNGSTYSSLPASIKFADSSTLNFSAAANTGFQFQNWQSATHTVLPGNTANPMQFQLTQPDTVVANFTAIPPPPDSVDLVLQAFPANGGSITLNGTVYSTYPVNLRVATAVPLSFLATPNANMAFVNWHSVFHTPLPNDTSNPMQFNIAATDTVYAFFLPIPPPPPDSFSVYINVSPPGAGQVTVAGITPASYPAILKFEKNINIDFSAVGDTVPGTTADFVYMFDHYQFKRQKPIPDSISPVVYVNLKQSDTVFAFFVKVPLPKPDSTLRVYFPNAFSPNGDGENDVFRPWQNGDRLANFEMQIFNRWGEKVFVSDNFGLGWDGNNHISATPPGQDSKCPVGAYTYIATGEREPGVQLRFSGSVVLVR